MAAQLTHQTLLEKLEVAIPGARSEPSPRLAGLDGPMAPSSTEAWRVVLQAPTRLRILAMASTEREAIDRAVFLYGERR